MSHVTPKIGSAVWVAVDGADMMIIGTIAPIGPPACHVYRSTNQTGLVSGTATNVTWEATAFDPWSMWSSGANVTVPLNGVYSITANVAFAADAAGTYRQADILVAGTTRAYVRHTGTMGAAANTSVSVSCIYTAAKNEAISVQVTSNQTTSYSLIAVSRIPFLAVTYLGPYG
jgi:hypothetical protein